MAKALPYFKWFAADAETDDFYAGLTNEELGFYHRCLNRAWLNGGIPKDLDTLATVLRMTRRQVDRVWVKVGQRWAQSPHDSDKLVNSRQEEERSLAAQKSDNNKRPGNANASRTRHERDAIGTPRAYVSVSESESALKEEVITFAKRASGRFQEWWAMWSAIRGTNHLMQAEAVYLREVTIYTENDCMECTRTYLASLTDPSKGFHPENFLIDQAPGKFKARFTARSPPKNQRGTCTTEELAQSIEAFGRTRV